MTEELRNEFIKKLDRAKELCCQLLEKDRTDEGIMVGLEIFDTIDYALMSGDRVIKQHIQLMDFILKKLNERVTEIGVAEG